MAESDSESSWSSTGSDSDASPGAKAQPESEPRNIFKNDGSFLKMFQLLQQEGKPKSGHLAVGVQKAPGKPSPPNSRSSPPVSQTPPLSSSHSCQSSASGKEPTRKKLLKSYDTISPLTAPSKQLKVRKRRGGKVLPTGIVKKQLKDGPVKKSRCPKDAWSRYMEEVRKYKEISCEEEGKNRPLVK